jgi:hypothetical protein
MDPTLFTWSFSMAHDLDRRFGRTPTLTMSSRDVPGITRSVIPLAAQQGIVAYTEGVNGGCAPAAVPQLFVWHDNVTGAELITMWHRGGYGGIGLSDCLVVDSVKAILAYAIKVDNRGPHTLAEVNATYAQLEQEYPGATIFASTYDNFVRAVLPVRNTLPVVTKEIGDTWVRAKRPAVWCGRTRGDGGIPANVTVAHGVQVYGVPSDPVKVSVFREISRARAECLELALCDPNDYAFKNLSRFLVKPPEHTWYERFTLCVCVCVCVCVCMYVCVYVRSGATVRPRLECRLRRGLPYLGDNSFWSNAQLATARNSTNYRNNEQAWLEQRMYNNNSIAALPTNHPLYVDLQQRLQGTVAVDGSPPAGCAESIV